MVTVSNLKPAASVIAGLCALLWVFEERAETGSFPDKIRHTRVNLLLFSGRATLYASLGFLVIKAATWSGESHFGLLSRYPISRPLQWIIGFLLMDLGGYFIHRISHRIPVLWRLHKVHHSDTVVDVSTYFRTHPGEAVLLWLWFLGVVIALAPPVALLEVSALATLVSALLQHADLPLPAKAEALISRVWITGRLHRIHHSQLTLETDSNFGALFAIWDQLFRTYRLAAEKPLRLGLAEYTSASSQTLRNLLRMPLL